MGRRLLPEVELPHPYASFHWRMPVLLCEDFSIVTQWFHGNESMAKNSIDGKKKFQNSTLQRKKEQQK